MLSKLVGAGCRANATRPLALRQAAPSASHAPLSHSYFRQDRRHYNSPPCALASRPTVSPLTLALRSGPSSPNPRSCIGLLVVGALSALASFFVVEAAAEDQKPAAASTRGHHSPASNQDAKDGAVAEPKKEKPKPFIVQREKNGKPHVIVLGTGWAAVSFVKSLGDAYDVTVVSPRNYFLFSPLLPSCTVGTLEDRTVMQPIRSFFKRRIWQNKGPNITFYEAACTSIDPATNSVICEDISEIKGPNPLFQLSYDYLVVAVGSENNTFGTPGVYEHANFLKNINDAKAIRSKIIDAFETATHPSNSKEDRQKLLSFVVVGGGPTGCEFAAELHDLLKEDLASVFPNVLEDVSIHLVQSQDHILNTFDEKISIYTKEKFQRNKIDVKVNTRVKEVKDNEVVVVDKKTNKEYSIPFALCVWSTGITRTKLVKDFCDTLKSKGQDNRVAITTDRFLKVKGTDNVFAIGDCGCVENKLLFDKFDTLFAEFDVNKDGVIEYSEFESFIKSVSTNYPQLEVYGRNLIETFHEMDVSRDGKLEPEEFKALLKEADRNVKMLPATAQVASQEGKYLATSFNRMATGQQSEPFRYRHLGSFAYIGSDDAVADIPGLVKGGGLGVWLMWRGVYLQEQFSVRNMLLTSFDWIKASLFGRDISRF